MLAQIKFNPDDIINEPFATIYSNSSELNKVLYLIHHMALGKSYDIYLTMTKFLLRQKVNEFTSNGNLTITAKYHSTHIDKNITYLIVDSIISKEVIKSSVDLYNQYYGKEYNNIVVLV
jgi:hypothetical protein